MKLSRIATFFLGLFATAKSVQENKNPSEFDSIVPSIIGNPLHTKDHNSGISADGYKVNDIPNPDRNLRNCRENNYKEYVRLKCEILANKKTHHGFVVIDFNINSKGEKLPNRVKKAVKKYFKKDGVQILTLEKGGKEYSADKVIIWQDNPLAKKGMDLLTGSLNKKSIALGKGDMSEIVKHGQSYIRILGENSGIDKVSISGFLLNDFFEEAQKDGGFGIYKSMSEPLIGLSPEGSFSTKDQSLIKSLFSKMEKRGLSVTANSVYAPGNHRHISFHETKNNKKDDLLLKEFAHYVLDAANEVRLETIFDKKRTRSQTDDGETYSKYPALSDEKVAGIKEKLNEIRKDRSPKSKVTGVKKSETLQDPNKFHSTEL